MTFCVLFVTGLSDFFCIHVYPPPMWRDGDQEALVRESMSLHFFIKVEEVLKKEDLERHQNSEGEGIRIFMTPLDMQGMLLTRSLWHGHFVKFPNHPFHSTTQPPRGAAFNPARMDHQSCLANLMTSHYIAHPITRKENAVISVPDPSSRWIRPFTPIVGGNIRTSWFVHRLLLTSKSPYKTMHSNNEEQRTTPAGTYINFLE